MTRNEYKHLPDGIAVQCYTPYLSRDCYPIDHVFGREEPVIISDEMIITSVPIATIAYFTESHVSVRNNHYNIFVGEIRGEPYRFLLDYETFGKHWHVPKELNR